MNYYLRMLKAIINALGQKATRKYGWAAIHCLLSRPVNESASLVVIDPIAVKALLYDKGPVNKDTYRNAIALTTFISEWVTENVPVHRQLLSDAIDAIHYRHTDNECTQICRAIAHDKTPFCRLSIRLHINDVIDYPTLVSYRKSFVIMDHLLQFGLLRDTDRLILNYINTCEVN